MAVKLGEMLIKAGLLTPQKLQEALEYQKTNGGKLGLNLVKLGFVKEEDITRVLSQQYGVPAINLTKVEVDDTVVKLIPSEVAQKYLIMPVSRTGATLTIAMVDPTNVFAMDDIKFMTGYNVEPVVASETSLEDAIEKYYGSTRSLQLKQDGGGGGGAQHHQTTTSSNFGKLGDAPSLRDVMDGPTLSLRLKIMAKLDISEKRLPQDGRIKIRLKIEDRSREMDFRVSSLPTIWGEKVVLRLLDKTKLMLDMTKLGFEAEPLERFKRAIAKPYGIVLVTGPTGSGKTNTLYSAIASLNKPDTNIMTAEDPVEFNLPGINQVQIKDQIGLNFASALRPFLRQDPNTVLVGDIRDYETAEIAVKAALTGHLVLSTLHTNDAPSTVSRLVNMGIEPFLVGTSVTLICAKR